LVSNIHITENNDWFADHELLHVFIEEGIVLRSAIGKPQEIHS
jgi:hypothetical protein